MDERSGVVATWLRMAVRSGAGQDAIEAQPALIHRVMAVAGVAAEHFVAAFAGEDDGDVFPGQLGNEVERDAGGPGDGLVFMPDEARQGVEEVLHADDDFGVLGSDGLRDVAGVGELTVFGFLVANGEGLDGSVEVALHESGDGGRIDAAGEKHAERDVAHETHADGLFEAVAAFGDPGGIAARLGLGIWDLPILADLRAGAMRRRDRA